VTDDKFLTRGILVLFGVITLILVVAGLVFAAWDIADRFPEWATASVSALIGIVLGVLGGRGLGRSS
jgi:hypothetical protein